LHEKLLNGVKSLSLSPKLSKNNHATQKSCFEIQNSSLKIFDGFLSKSSLLLLQTVYTAMQIAYTVIREYQQNRWLFTGKLLRGDLHASDSSSANSTAEYTASRVSGKSVNFTWFGR